MKKIIQLLALFACFTAAAQNFPGEKIELLKDKTLKVLPKEASLQEFGFVDFYTDAGLKKVYKKSGTSTPYDVLVGKEFKVLSYEAYTYSVGTVHYKLLLENPETRKIYFDYDPKYAHAFPFEVIGGLAYPEGFFCDKIYEADMRSKKYSGRWYESPVEEGIHGNLCKQDKGDVFLFSANMATPEKYTSGILRRGFTITFDNGATIANSDKELESIKGPTGSLVLSLVTGISNPADLKLLQENKIIQLKLNNHEDKIVNGLTLREYFKCLISRMTTVTAAISTADCNSITLVKISPEGEKHYETPSIDGVVMKKVAAASLPDIYMGSVTVPSKTKTSGKGIIILFDNGDAIGYPDTEVLEKPLKDGTYEYIAVFLIKDQDINYFATSGIKGLQVGKVTKLIDKGADIQKIATCLISKE